MEQRHYKGTITPEQLATYLVQFYDPQPDRQAQVLGQGDPLLVQIGHGDDPNDIKGALTVGITHAADGSGVIVTMGEQQWLQAAHGGALIGILIGALFTPWALFGLIWPLSQAANMLALASDVWATIEQYCQSAGGTLANTNPSSGVACPRCGMLNPVGATMCVRCGQSLGGAPAAPLEATPVATPLNTAQTAATQPPPATGPTQRLDGLPCPNCGAISTPGARFCSICGTRLV